MTNRANFSQRYNLDNHISNELLADLYVKKLNID
jgi:hypothetical protein